MRVHSTMVVVVLALAGLAGSALPGCSRPGTPGFTATPCKGDYSFLPNRVACGDMRVEETRGSGNGRTVVFPVVIVRATAARKQPDPVIFLHGGPGGGIVGGLPKRLLKHEVPMAADRDWIFFDQRGGKLATPSLDCGALALSDAGLTSDRAVTDAQACGRRLAADGVDLSQYNSAVIVKDLADLRQALGIGAYNLYGISYGTRVALEVMARDPAQLRSVVLDSPWPPEASWSAPLPKLVSREWRKVLALCAAHAACASLYPGQEARHDALITTWLAHPPQTAEHAYSAEEMAAFLLDALYDDAGARSLPRTIDQVLQGDYSALDKFLRLQSNYAEGQFFTHLCKEEFAFESPAGIDVGDGSDPIVVATARATRRYFEACKGFAVGAPDPRENQPVTSAIPTLLLTGAIDAGCPTEFAQAAARHLVHGQAFDFPNTTHGPGKRSACAISMVKAFQARPLAPVDARCIPGDRPAFPFMLEP
jgi:pimeloyl-ACP methyl ester carboxylesterase